MVETLVRARERAPAFPPPISARAAGSVHTLAQSGSTNWSDDWRPRARDRAREVLTVVELLEPSIRTREIPAFRGQGSQRAQFATRECAWRFVTAHIIGARVGGVHGQRQSPPRANETMIRAVSVIVRRAVRG